MVIALLAVACFGALALLAAFGLVAAVFVERRFPVPALPGVEGAAPRPERTVPIICGRCGRSSHLDHYYCRTCGASLSGGVVRRQFADNRPDWPVVSARHVMASGLPVEEVPYLALGGGIGSFIWVDHLRVFGVEAESIRVVGPHAEPYRRFEWLCTNSQIDREDPLRSGSDARPDNLWGWPGYASSAAWRAAKRGRLAEAISTLFGLAAEPDFATAFVPKAGQVYAGIDREAARIGWSAMHVPGCVLWLRKTDDGRYVAAVESRGDEPGRLRYLVADYVHVSVGYGGIRVLPDMSRWRHGWGTGPQRTSLPAAPIHSQDPAAPFSLVQAYEPHDLLYGQLAQEGGTVLLRGRGITASRVLERLAQIRRHNPTVRVVHLMQSRRPTTVGWRRTRRRVAAHRDLQIFNWPKAAWGGEVRRVLARMNETERARTFSILGGTTTPPTPQYVETVRRGLAEGWYEIRFGTLTGLSTNGGLAAHIAPEGADVANVTFPVRGVIDATGLESGPLAHPILADLASRYGLAVNRGGGLEVDPATFEVLGMRNRRGRLYVAGAAAAGGQYAPVDSFLGLQVAALGSLGGLFRDGAPRVRKVRPLRSIAGWLRWRAGVAP